MNGFGYLFLLVAACAASYYAGGHPAQVAGWATTFVAWIKTKPWKKGT